MDTYSNKIDVYQFAVEILRDINMYQSPIDFSIMPAESCSSPELKRLDKSSIKIFKESIRDKKMLTPDDLITFRDIVGVALHIDSYSIIPQYSTYFKWLDERHDIQDDKCESIFQHTYNNITLLIHGIISLWDSVLYIPQIEDYLINKIDFINEGTINIKLQDICNFTFSLYSEILSLFRRQENVSTDDVNKIAERLLSSRYYSDVYLLITGYIYEENFDESKPVSYEERQFGELKEIYKWDFSLLQQRVSPKFYLSSEDKKKFAYYSDYVAKLAGEISSLSQKSDSAGEQLTSEQKEDLYNDLSNKKDKYELIVTGKKAVDRYRNETKAYRK